MEFVISISRPGNSWNLSEGHGKKQYDWQKRVLKIEQITDESETGFKIQLK